jgi:hypothetical protein
LQEVYWDRVSRWEVKGIPWGNQHLLTFALFFHTLVRIVRSGMERTVRIFLKVITSRKDYIYGLLFILMSADVPFWSKATWFLILSEQKKIQNNERRNHFYSCIV